MAANTILPQFGQLTIQVLQTEAYYIHIDVVNGSSSTVARHLNYFMVLQDSYDPRRSKKFPTESLADKGIMEINGPDVPLRRRFSSINDRSYEIWRVRPNFDTVGFSKMVEGFSGIVEIEMSKLINSNYHEQLTFCSTMAMAAKATF